MHQDIGFDYVEQIKCVLDDEYNLELTRIVRFAEDWSTMISPFHPLYEELHSAVKEFDWVPAAGGGWNVELPHRMDILREIQEFQEDMDELVDEIINVLEKANKEIERMAKKCRKEGVGVRAQYVESDLFRKMGYEYKRR